MDLEERKFLVECVQDRMGYLKLSFEQAEQVIEYEEEQNLYSLAGTVYSTWEELDYELYVFSKILNKKQLSIYSENRNLQIEYHKTSLTDADNSEDTLKGIA